MRIYVITITNFIHVPKISRSIVYYYIILLIMHSSKYNRDSLAATTSSNKSHSLVAEGLKFQTSALLSVKQCL